VEFENIIEEKEDFVVAIQDHSVKDNPIVSPSLFVFSFHKKKELASSFACFSFFEFNYFYKYYH
jgi:hypothetical protein